MTGLLHAAKIIQWIADRLGFGMKSHKENTSTVQLTLSLSLWDGHLWARTMCPSKRDMSVLQTGSKERQGTPLGVRFTVVRLIGVSVKRESTD